MEFASKETQEVITAYEIRAVVETDDSYSISMPELGMTVGVFKDQIDKPNIGDFYNDNGTIELSEIYSAVDIAVGYKDANAVAEPEVNNIENQVNIR